MQIKPMGRNYIGFKGAFGNKPRLTKESAINRLDFKTPSEELPPTFFSQNALENILLKPEDLGQEGFLELGSRVLKDSRLIQTMGNEYSFLAGHKQKIFKRSLKNNPERYEKSFKTIYGLPSSDIFDEIDPITKEKNRYYVTYNKHANVDEYDKYNGDTLRIAASTWPYKDKAKFNTFEYYNDGTPKTVKIGERNLTGGIKKTDKLFVYTEEGIMLYGASNVTEYPDKRKTMYSFIFPKPENNDVSDIERFALKRTENADDKTVTYHGLIVFRAKKFYKYFPELTVDKKTETEKLTPEKIKAYEDMGIKTY